uniref:hydroxymethylbilane synthase n=1 Tax=Timema genevievae TaxID=629358 RepID=A0A7R9JPI3_TIMGE|nr:unnamed protein product [Timema genevievae]
MDENIDIIKVGSRKSQLALIQTNHIVSILKGLYPNKTFELVTMTTIGDQILDKPLPKIGEKSLFTKELEIALEQQDVDLVVHSLKDLPTTLPDGMCIGAVCKREDARDAVVLHAKHKGKTLATLPKGSVIGTSSLRRASQLHLKYPDLKVKDVRGNLNTRLAKLDKGDSYDGLVLAAAGLERMGWEARVSQVYKHELEEMIGWEAPVSQIYKHELEEMIGWEAPVSQVYKHKLEEMIGWKARVSQVYKHELEEMIGWEAPVSQSLEAEDMMYAVGQGALAVECREDDFTILQMLEPLQHVSTTLRVAAERSFLRTLGGGCSAPVAVISKFNGSTLSLAGGVWSLDGTKSLSHYSDVTVNYSEEDDTGEPARKCPYRTPKLFCSISPGNMSYLDFHAAEKLGEDIAQGLIHQGALDVMNEAKQHVQGSITPQQKILLAGECLWDMKHPSAIQSVPISTSLDNDSATFIDTTKKAIPSHEIKASKSVPETNLNDLNHTKPSLDNKNSFTEDHNSDLSISHSKNHHDSAAIAT